MKKANIWYLAKDNVHKNKNAKTRNHSQISPAILDHTKTKVKHYRISPEKAWLGSDHSVAVGK
jgi:hypothetical protein